MIYDLYYRYVLSPYRNCRDYLYDSHIVIKVCLKVIAFFYRVKDNQLADKLHDFAGRYQSRPQEGWSPPKEWECWKD